MVYRGGPTGRRLALDDGTATAVPGAAGTTTSARPPRIVGPERAAEHLRLAGLPFVFFHDPDAARARVVHLDERGRVVLVDVEAGPVESGSGPLPLS